MTKKLIGELELNRIYQRDCIEGMRMLPDKSIDLIIADPPYNKGVAAWDKFSLEDYVKFMRDCIAEFKRVLSDRGTLFMYNQQPFASYMVVELAEQLSYVDEIIWYYKNGGSGGKKLKNAHQLLYWFSKTNEYTKNIEEIRQPYSGTRAIYKHNVDKNPAKAWTPNDNGALPTNVWEISIVRQTEKTPLTRLSVQKPLAICDRVVRLGSNEGDTVLIPFTGSGSECVSALRNIRNFVAFELNEEYIEIANKRLDNEILPE